MINSKYNNHSNSHINNKLYNHFKHYSMNNQNNNENINSNKKNIDSNNNSNNDSNIDSNNKIDFNYGLCSFTERSQLLNGKQFAIEDLEKIVKNCDIALGNILTTQKKLTSDFCAKYFLEPDNKYATNKKDNKIDFHEILRYQKHLHFIDLNKSYRKFYQNDIPYNY